ncbi:MAG: DUF5320 domain-containing protein [Sedimentibacter sp.]
MPRRDGTGPMGMNSMPARGFGFRKDNSIYGRGNCYGYGLGNGLGCRFGYESNKELLQKKKEILEIQLKIIEKQLEGQ